MEKIKLKICCGMNCLNHGGQELLDFMENDSHVQNFCEIEASICLDGCDSGKNSPVVQVGEIFMDSMTPDKLINVINSKIEELKKE